MNLSAETYLAVTGELAPEDFPACLTLAQSMLDARTLCFYADKDEAALPALITRALTRYLVYQTQATSLAGGVAGVMETPQQSGSLGKYSFVGGVGGSAHCPAAAALLPLLVSYARCD